MTLRAWDQTSGSEEQKSTPQRMEAHAFSTNTDTVNITVNELGELNIEIDSIQNS